LNEAFTPPAADVAKAEAIIKAAEQQTRSGVGAFRLDGKMIDEPVVERARRLLDRARGHRR